jgi:hypothetical protein
MLFAGCALGLATAQLLHQPLHRRESDQVERAISIAETNQQGWRQCLDQLQQLTSAMHRTALPAQP